MCKTCWVVALILFLITTGMANKFMIKGSVTKSNDQRISLLLEPNEKGLLLFEMKTFLESVQKITNGLVKDDMQTIADGDLQGGVKAKNEVPGSLMAKLPLSFKKLGFDTHRKFDQIATDAKEKGDKEHSLSQLDALLQNCVACHAGHKIVTPSDN